LAAAIGTAEAVPYPKPIYETSSNMEPTIELCFELNCNLKFEWLAIVPLDWRLAVEIFALLLVEFVEIEIGATREC
jgi:hypothetical protein